MFFVSYLARERSVCFSRSWDSAHRTWSPSCKIRGMCFSSPDFQLIFLCCLAKR